MVVAEGEDWPGLRHNRAWSYPGTFWQEDPTPPTTTQVSFCKECLIN